MSILDENIEISFETLLESLGWSKVERHIYPTGYTISGLDCAGRYFSIDFFPKGYIYKEVSENHDKYIVKRSRKDQWRIYYQREYNSKSIGYPYYECKTYNIRMDRESVIQLMNDIKNITFNPKNYKVIKK